jgi:hypothetical protein
MRAFLPIDFEPGSDLSVKKLHKKKQIARYTL